MRLDCTLHLPPHGHTSHAPHGWWIECDVGARAAWGWRDDGSIIPVCMPLLAFPILKLLRSIVATPVCGDREEALAAAGGL